MALIKALASPLHRAVDAPPGDHRLRAASSPTAFTTQVAQQLHLSATLLRRVTGRYVDNQVLLVGPAVAERPAALAAAGVRNDVVLPESDLSRGSLDDPQLGRPLPRPRARGR